MTAMRSRAKAHGHLLHNERHEECQNHERNEKSDTVARAGGGIGEHAGAVVFSQHDENARADKKPQEAKSGEYAATGARGEHAIAVLRTIDVLVSDDNVGGGLRGSVRRRYGFGEGPIHSGVFPYPSPARMQKEFWRT